MSKITFHTYIYKNRPTADGRLPVVIRVTYKRQSKYIQTGYTCSNRQLSKDRSEITARPLLLSIDRHIQEYEDFLRSATIPEEWNVNDVVEFLTTKKSTQSFININESDEPCIIEYMSSMINKMKKQNRRSWSNFSSALNKIIEYNRGRRHFFFYECTVKWLNDFNRFLLDNSGPRAASLYITCIRTTFNNARAELNDEDNEVIKIANYPFSRFKIQDTSEVKSRALTAVDIARIADIEFERPKNARDGEIYRAEYARDMFMLSFYLCGINSADLYDLSATKNGYIEYERKKTRDKRKDRARMKLAVPQEAERLTHKHHFMHKFVDASQHYTNFADFNKSINIGLKQVGKIVGINGLTYYAARHSWATIAHNDCHVPLSVVSLALNQSFGDTGAEVTQRYVRKDFSNIDDANKRVISYVNTCRRWSSALKKMKHYIELFI